MAWTCFGIFDSKKKEKRLSLLELESKPYDLYSSPNDTIYQAALTITNECVIPNADPYFEGYHHRTEDKNSSWVVYHNSESKTMGYALYLLYNEPKNIRVNFTVEDTKAIHAAINSKLTIAAP